MRRLRLAALALILTITAYCQVDGAAVYRDFLKWREIPSNGALKWEAAVTQYAENLAAGGLSRDEVSKRIRIIEARDEAILYDPVYAARPRFETAPTALLVEAVKQRAPGIALDVAMGQGRNSLFLARQGWNVTGFDVSATGLAEARRQAEAAGVSIHTVLASDEEFEFGENRWDLIAILYPIEKRSVYRVRAALKPGGIVVVECGHKDARNAPFEYETNELLKIFEGFRILKYEDTLAMHEWARKKMRMVRLIAEKPPLTSP